MQKQLLLKKTSNRFIAFGIAVSTNHMSPYKHDNVCKKCATTLRASLPDDLQSVVYNRQCHQRFATNLNLLGNETEPEAPISQISILTKDNTWQ